MKFSSQSKFPLQKQNNFAYTEDRYPTFKHPHPQRVMMPLPSNLCTSRSTQKQFITIRDSISQTDHQHDKKMREGYEELAQITKRQFQNLSERNIFLKRQALKQDKRILTLQMHLQTLQSQMQQMITSMDESNTNLNEIQIKIKTAPTSYEFENSALDTTFFDKSNEEEDNALQSYLMVRQSQMRQQEEEQNKEHIFEQRIAQLSQELKELMEECARQKNVSKKKGYREELKGLANTLKRVKSSDHFTKY